MLRTTIPLTLGLLLLLPAALHAQEASEPDPAIEAMAQLEPMIGSWQGSGWMRRGPSEPEPFEGSEKIESRLDGRVILIEGRHRDPGSGEVVHHAFATLSYDAERADYRFRSHLSTGQSGDYRGRFEDGAFVWGMEVPGRGEIRYTIRIDGDRWDEVGEFSSDGETWNQFFAMELERAEALEE